MGYAGKDLRISLHLKKKTFILTLAQDSIQHCGMRLTNGTLELLTNIN